MKWSINIPAWFIKTWCKCTLLICLYNINRQSHPTYGLNKSQVQAPGTVEIYDRLVRFLSRKRKFLLLPIYSSNQFCCTMLINLRAICFTAKQQVDVQSRCTKKKDDHFCHKFLSLSQHVARFPTLLSCHVTHVLFVYSVMRLCFGALSIPSAIVLLSNVGTCSVFSL